MRTAAGLGIGVIAAGTFAAGIGAGNPALAGCPPDLQVPITGGTGEPGDPVVFSFRDRPPAVGGFFPVGSGLENNSGDLSPAAWFLPLGDLDGDGSIEYRLEVPGGGPGGWGDPRSLGCPATAATPYPPLALILRQDREDLDDDGRWDVFEDRDRDGTLDPGEDRDGDGRLTPALVATPFGSFSGCEGSTREDVDCDGFIDVINEDFNSNGRFDPGEVAGPNDGNWDNINEDRNKDGVFDPLTEDTNGNGVWDGRGQYVEDRNNDRFLNDRPVVQPDDQIFHILPDGTRSQISPLYPYGALQPAQGSFVAASVSWSGGAYDFDAIDVPLRTIVLQDGRTFRVIDAVPLERLIPRVSAVRVQEMPRFGYRVFIEPPAIEGIDDAGGTRRIVPGYQAGLQAPGPIDYGEVFVETDDPIGLPVAPVPPEGRFLTIVSSIVNVPFPRHRALRLFPFGVPTEPFLFPPAALPAQLAPDILDADGDRLSLPFDTCPEVRTPDPGLPPDSNLDGIGDACDPAMGPAVEPTGAWNTRPDDDGDPGPVPGAAMAYDAARGRIVLVGGLSDTATWEYDGTTWSRIATSAAPSARSGHRMVYDATGARILLYGGAGAAFAPLNDLWQYREGIWSRIETVVAPPPAEPSECAIAWHEARRVLVLFLGTGQTWIFDGLTWKVAPSPRSPSPRSFAVMTYDPRREVVVLAGGIASSIHPDAAVRPLNDTWEFDGTFWQPGDTRGDLTPHMGGTMAWDNVRRRMMLFGGISTASFLPSPDQPESIHSFLSAATRLYHGIDWSYLPTRPTVPPLTHGSAAYDTARDRLVVRGIAGAPGLQEAVTAELHLPEDSDGDGVRDRMDLCPLTPDPGQADEDRDGTGDACDNCPSDPDPTQRDLDRDRAGDTCDDDRDGDGIPNADDDCPAAYVAGRPLPEILGGGGPDTDLDGTADDCDVCPGDPHDDADGDGRCGDADNCPTTFNILQEDGNGDGSGDACQPVLILSEVREDGGETLEVTARASDPDGDPLGGTIDFIAIEEHVLRGIDLGDPDSFCGSDVYPTGRPGEGIVYGTNPTGERFLTDLDGAVGCLDGVLDFLIAPGRCGAIPGPGFQPTLTLAKPPQEICVGRSDPLAPGGVDPMSLVDLTVLAADDRTVRLATVESTPALRISFAGGLPARSDLEGLAAGTRYRFLITVTDGSSVPVTVETTLLYQGESRLVIHSGAPRAVIQGGGTVECDRPEGGPVTLDGTGSGAPEPGQGELSFEWFEDLGGPAERLLGSDGIISTVLPLGEHEILLRVTNVAGIADIARVVITVRDTLPPELAVVTDPPVLWPPNHRLVPVEVLVQVRDVCDAAPGAILLAVASSEPDDGSGDGDGRTTGDIADADTGTLDTRIQLRAERSASGSGRTYEVAYRAADASGNQVSMSTLVRVPIDPGPGLDDRRP
ncbi:MAG: thrombospondin type 3 repeat-containing protein [Candidatus Polarisedimenticolia bacterium]